MGSKMSKFTEDYRPLIHNVAYKNIQNMGPRERDYLGIRRTSYLGREGVVTVWLIDPIPLSELKGFGWCECKICKWK